MTDAELNKLLHEKVMGKCWHEWSAYESGTFLEKCGKCGETVLMGKTLPVPSYTTNPAEYWELLMWCKGQENWDEFLITITIDKQWSQGSVYGIIYALNILLDMSKGCSAILEFFGKEGG